MIRIAIIGCGVVGAAIAYELSLIEGLDITLLDRKTPASGSTGAALGVLMGTISHKTKGRAWQLRSASMRRYATLIPELEAITKQTIPHNRHGIVKLRFAGEKLAKWEKLQQLRRQEGWQLEIWDAAQLKVKCPQVENERVVGGIYSPQDLQINPVALTQALVAAAQMRGVRTLFGVKLEQILTQGNRCTGIQTTAGNLAVDWLIISAGLGSTNLTSSLEQPLDLRPVLGQAIQVKLPYSLGNPQFQPVITGEDLNIVPIAENEYWIGATVEFADESGEVVANTALLEQMKQQAISFCGDLAHASIISSWSGKRPRPEGRSAPIIEQSPAYPNLILATGHYRNGVLLAPATALNIRELIVSKI